MNRPEKQAEQTSKINVERKLYLRVSKGKEWWSIAVPSREGSVDMKRVKNWFCTPESPHREDEFPIISSFENQRD